MDSPIMVKEFKIINKDRRAHHVIRNSDSEYDYDRDLVVEDSDRQATNSNYAPQASF